MLAMTESGCTGLFGAKIEGDYRSPSLKLWRSELLRNDGKQLILPNPPLKKEGIIARF